MIHKKILTAISLAACLVCVVGLLGAGKPEFDITRYGAIPDDGVDDTDEIRAAVVDAMAAGTPCKIVFPRGRYNVGDPSTSVLGTNSTITNAPITISAGADDIDVIGYGAVLDIDDTNGVSNAVFRTFADRTRVFGLTIDCDAGDAIQAAKGCSGFEVNGGTDCEFVDCKAEGGFFDQDNPNQGQEHFLAVNAIRPKWINCDSYNCGWTAFRSAADDDFFLGCTAIEHRGNGFRLTQGTTARLLGCVSRSSLNEGRSGFLLDPGSTPTYPVNRRTRIFFHHCVGYSSANGTTGCALLKLAAADAVYIDNCEFEVATGNTSSINYAVRLEDNLRKVVFANTYVKGGFIFTPSQFHGTVSGNADNGGYAQLTLGSGHGIVEGDTIFVQDSAIPEYNRPHNVQSVDTTTVTTDVAYVSGSIGASAYAHEGVDEVRITNMTLENDWDDTGADQVDLIQSAHCRILDIENSTLRYNGVRTEKLRGIGWYMPDAGVDLLRFRNVEVIGDTSNVFSALKPLEDRGTDEIQTVTVTGTPTGGSFTLTSTDYGTTPAINWNATPATTGSNMQTQLRTLTGLDSVTVSTSGATWANVVFTITCAGTMGNIPQFTSSSSLTGGSPNIAHATTTAGVRSTQLVTSGKSIGQNFTIVNRGTGTTYLVSPYQATDVGTPYADRLTLFNSVGDATGHYRATAEPTSGAVTWAVGDVIENSAPAIGTADKWTLRTAGAPGTWDEVLKNNGMLYRNVVPAGSGESGEQTMMSYTVPAGVLKSGNDALEINAGFQMADNTNAKTIKLSVGGTTVFDSGAVAHRNGYVSMRATIARRTSANLRVTVDVVSTASSGTPVATGAYFTSVTYDLEPNNVATTLALLCLGNGTTDNDVQQQLFSVCYLPSPQ